MTPLDNIWSVHATQIITNHLRFDWDTVSADTPHIPIDKSAIQSAEMRFEQSVSKTIYGKYLWLLRSHKSPFGLGYSKLVLDQSSNYKMVDKCHCEPLQPKWQLTFYDRSTLSNKVSVSCLAVWYSFRGAVRTAACCFHYTTSLEFLKDIHEVEY